MSEGERVSDDIEVRERASVEKQKRRNGLTGNADKLPRAGRDQLLLEQASTTALDAVQLVVDLVGTVKGNIEHDVLGQAVKAHGHEAGLLNDLSRLETGGDEEDVTAVRGRGFGQAVLDGLDTVDDGAAGADSDKLHLGVEVVGNGTVCGLALGLFNHVDGSGSDGRGGGCGGGGHVVGRLVWAV